MLDKWDNLLIRECKSKIPNARKLRKILAMRNGIHLEHAEDIFLADLLLDIVLDYDLTNGRMNHLILTKFSPEEQRYMHDLGLDNSHVSNIIRACVSTIRLSKADKFPNFHKSLKFRLQEKA